MQARSTRERAGAILTIDLDALRANYRLLRARAAPAACSAVLKSNAYGLGAVPVAGALYEEGCRHFFVAHLDEGIALRPHLAGDADIFVLHGPPPGTERECLSHQLIPVLNSLPQLAAWRALAASEGRALAAVVQVCTGMSRMGLALAEVDSWLADPAGLDGIDMRFVMSHLACADEADNPMNALQLERFTAVRARLPACPASLANSSGIFLGSEFHLDLVRPGAALYGISPMAGRPNPMRPVVRLQGRIIQTRTIAPGEHVGYCLNYTARVTRQVATVAVGYADGWLRTMSNRGLAVVDGVCVPQIGNISMDSITLDVSALQAERVAPGCLVDLICPAHPVDAVAGLADTIGYEVLTRLGPRLHREYIGVRSLAPVALAA
ncbi:MAG: alanine racemase [Pseudomonadota bacterium]